MNLFNLDLNDTPTVPSLLGVKNEFPSVEAPYRIAFVGACPGESDVKTQRPFQGTAGDVLRSLLGQVGLSPMSVMFANVCQHPNYIKSKGKTIFNWNSPNVEAGLEQLKLDLDRYKPNLIVLLGDNALRAGGKPGESVSNWHGSLFRCEMLDSPCHGYKCMATYDPLDVFRTYEWMPLLRLNLARAAEEALTPELNLPQRSYELNLSAYAIIEKLRHWPAGLPMALDIEGYVYRITCLSIASSPNDAFIIPFGIFPKADDERIIEQLRITMARHDIPKILQNCVYDYFALALTHKIILANIAFDTMLSGWEHYPELLKNLGMQTAIWTREPYYKFQRKIDHTVTHWKYCCTDSCVTYEIAQRHEQAFTKPALDHFRFNMELLPAINYMMIKGMRFDSERASELLAASQLKQDEIQLRLNIAAGKKVQVNSPKQLGAILYKQMHFPVQHPKKAGKIDRTKQTTNVDALLEINKHYDSSFVRDLIAWRKCEKLQQTLVVPTSPLDGRIRCSYNLVGTDTGRLNCQASAEPSTVFDSKTGKFKQVGTNLTTITKKLRHLFRADEGYHYFQCDLAGADGWTVAAHCARFGDPTMLDDYLYGIKPARVIAYMFVHGQESNQLTRDELASAIKGFGGDHDTKENQMLYFVCKRVQHGTNYLLGPPTMADQILKDSFKLTGTPIYVEPKTCAQLQTLYLLRYKGVAAWQTWIKQEIRTKGKLSCASGHVRTFFGRRTDHKTIRSAVAHEPQANTTYATNLAFHRLWHDPENRNPDNSLIIQPLHQVHDAMCGQFPIDLTSWATAKISSYFNNELTIGNTTLVIPFEGNYGPSWGEQPFAF